MLRQLRWSEIALIAIEGIARPDIHTQTVQQEGVLLTKSLELAQLRLRSEHPLLEDDFQRGQ
jgi:hypothetical protein